MVVETNALYLHPSGPLIDGGSCVCGKQGHGCDCLRPAPRREEVLTRESLLCVQCLGGSRPVLICVMA